MQLYPGIHFQFITLKVSYVKTLYAIAMIVKFSKKNMVF